MLGTVGGNGPATLRVTSSALGFGIKPFGVAFRT